MAGDPTWESEDLGVISLLSELGQTIHSPAWGVEGSTCEPKTDLCGQVAILSIVWGRGWTFGARSGDESLGAPLLHWNPSACQPEALCPPASFC